MSKFLKVVAVIMFSALILIGCSKDENLIDNGQLEVSVINVGQGDAIFIKTPDNKNILIDSGSREDKDKLYEFLKSKNIKNIDLLVGTHPHEDHIGNMASVIRDYTIGQVYMPKVTHTTKTFKNVMEAIKEKSVSLKAPSVGDTLDFNGAIFKILAPNSGKYKDINNYSIVMKLTYKNNSFLFMGDAEKESEKEIIKKGETLKADVIKLGHHGSSTSNTKEFIEKVNPKYAVASCGKNNEYGHPHKEVVKLLGNLNIKLYKTYESGTVTFTSNGSNITVNTQNKL